MEKKVIFSLVALSLSLFYNNLLAQGTNSDTRDSVLSLPSSKREHLQKSPYIYERYYVPSQCNWAAERAKQRYRRNLRMDTVFFSRTQDTIPSEVKEVVKACMEKFDPNTTPIEYLIGAYAPYIFQGEYNKSQLVIQRFLKEYPQNDTAQTRRKALMLSRAGKIVEAFSNPDAAARFFERAKIIEDMGMPLYADNYQSVFDIASDLLLPDLGIDGARRYINAWTKWKNEEMMDWGDPNRSFQSLVAFSFYKEGLQYARNLVRDEFIPILQARMGGSEENRRSLNERSDRELNRYEPLGAAPPLLAKYWFDSTGIPQEKLPRPGRVTMIFPSIPEASGNDYYRFNLIRRLSEKFHGKGLDIIILTRLKGHFRLQVMENKEQELESLRKYYLEYLKLPVTLAVDEVRFSKRFDGARLPEEIPWRRLWPTEFPINGGIVIGPDGEFITTNLETNKWRRVFQMVEHALNLEVK